MVYLGRYPAGKVNRVLPVLAPVTQPRTRTLPVTEMAKEAGLVLPPAMPLDKVAAIHPLGVTNGVTNGGTPVRLA